MRWVAPLLAFVVLASCEQETPVPDRLVSGEAYYSQGSGQEIILISRGFGGEGLGVHRLTFELAPDDELKVSYWLMTERQPIAEERHNISSDVANQLRREMWRLRPEKFTDNLHEDWPTLPLGCDRVGSHDFPETWVMFLTDWDKPEGRAFDLPTARSCNSSAAKEARTLIEGAIASFPNSKIADEFHKAMSEDDPYDYSPDPQPIQSLAE